MLETLDVVVQARVNSAKLARACVGMNMSRSAIVRHALDLLLDKLYDASDAETSQRQVNRAPGPVVVSPSSTAPAPGPVHDASEALGLRSKPLFSPAEADEIESLLKELGE